MLRLILIFGANNMLSMKCQALFSVEKHKKNKNVRASQSILFAIQASKNNHQGAQWLSGRVLISRSRDCGFKPPRHHSFVSMSKIQ